jgi:hypothetical protein
MNYLVFIVQDERSNSHLVGCIRRDGGWYIRYPGHQHHIRALRMMVTEALLHK